MYVCTSLHPQYKQSNILNVMPDFICSLEGGHLLFHCAGHNASGQATAALDDGANPESAGIVRDEKKELRWRWVHLGCPDWSGSRVVLRWIRWIPKTLGEVARLRQLHQLNYYPY